MVLLCAKFMLKFAIGVEFAVCGTYPFALKPPLADMREFSSAKTRLKSFCAAEGKAVMNAGGAVGIVLPAILFTLSKYDSTVERSAGFVEACAKSASTVGFSRKDCTNSESSEQSLYIRSVVFCFLYSFLSRTLVLDFGRKKWRMPVNDSQRHA